jgi:NADH-ubiquinone oxidoreductase chain 4
MLGSVSLFIALIWLISTMGVTDYTALNYSLLNYNNYNTAWLLLGLGLAIKVPSVPLHIWLTRAHVEANVSTSVVLAAVILKLSTYGTIVFLLLILPYGSAYYSSLWLLLGLISFIHASLSTLSQIDSKVLIAYSSVAHMSIITIGLHSNHYIGIIGALLLAVAHASSSSALFIIFGQVLYDRLHTRVLYYIRNITSYSPSLRTTLLFAIVSNAGTPSTLNWVAEWYALLGIAHSNLLVSVLLASTVLLTASYSFWLYSYTTSQIGNYVLYDLTNIEQSNLLYLLVPNILLGLNVWLIESYLINGSIALMY